MAAEQFSDSFWVAIAAASPVIGLASAVTADQTARRSERARKRASRERRTSEPEYPAAFWISYANICFQAAVLLSALQSLRRHIDFVPKDLASIGAVVGMIFVIVPTMVAAGSNRARRSPGSG